MKLCDIQMFFFSSFFFFKNYYCCCCCYFRPVMDTMSTEATFSEELSRDYFTDVILGLEYCELICTIKINFCYIYCICIQYILSMLSTGISNLKTCC